MMVWFIDKNADLMMPYAYFLAFVFSGGKVIEEQFNIELMTN